MIPSLEELAAFLTTPAESGLCLSKSDLIGLARSVEGSLRVNERKRMLVDIFQCPQNPQEMGELVEWMKRRAEADRSYYLALIGDYSASEPYLRPWIQRCEGTIQKMNELKAYLSMAPG